MRQPYIEQRPWGKFEQFTHNEKTTVKIIEIHNGRRISLQSHHHREEWWIALDNGVITEINGEKRILNKGEHAFIPSGAKHRLTAVNETVRVLEIAFGHFDENDNTRYEDDFGRV